MILNIILILYLNLDSVVITVKLRYSIMSSKEEKEALREAKNYPHPTKLRVQPTPNKYLSCTEVSSEVYAGLQENELFEGESMFDYVSFSYSM